MKKYCPNCKRIPEKDVSNFCSHCQTKLVEDNRKDSEILSDDISVIKNKIIWNVPQGEIAYKISYEEIETLSGVKGIIVNDGMTAYIYTNGVLISEVHEGNYDFIDSEELDKRLRARYGGLANGWSRIKKALSRFWFGLSLYDRKEHKNGIESHVSQDQIVDSLRKDSLYTIILKVDKEFQLFFEIPITTNEYNGTVGLNLSLKITDFREFIQHFELNGANKRVAALDVKNQLSKLVETCMKYESFEKGNVSGSTISHILSRLQSGIGAINCGLSITRINDFTIDSADLERLRGIEREIYLSGEELDRLHKIIIIKNRLSSEENQQIIERAKTDYELAISLAEINKDKILAEDEMQAFAETLTFARKLRTAQKQEEFDDAISKIERAGILRKVDLDILLSEVAENKYKRETAFTLIQLQDSIKRCQIEQEAKHEIEKSDISYQVNISRIKDAYKDERVLKDLELESKQFRSKLEQQKMIKDEEIRIANAKADLKIRTIKELNDIQVGRANALHENQLAEANAKYAHEEKDLEIKAGMSPEQIEAVEVSKMVPEAQVEYFSGKYKVAIAQAQEQAAQGNAALAERTMKEMLDRMDALSRYAIGAVSGNIAQERQRAEEYRQSLHRTEDRLDRQQEHIIDRTFDRPSERKDQTPTISLAAPVAPQPTILPKTTKVVCPHCKKDNDLLDGDYCAYCGNPLTTNK